MRERWQHTGDGKLRALGGESLVELREAESHLVICLSKCSRRSRFQPEPTLAEHMTPSCGVVLMG